MMHRLIFTPLLLSILILADASRMQAALLAHEGFDYANSGSALLNGKTGGTGWGGPWQFSGVSATNNGGFNLSQDDQSLNSSAYPFSATGDRVLAAGFGTGANSAQADRLLATPFDLSVEGNVMYASLLFRKDGSSTATSSDNMEFTFLANLGAGTPAVPIRVGSTSTERFFVFDGGSVPASATFEDLTLGQTYFVVIKIEAHAGTNPNVYSVVTYAPGETVPATEPNVWEGVRNLSVSNAVLDGVRLWIGTVSSGQFDEIRVGDSWASVAVVPEPTLLCLMLPAGLGLALRGRTARQGRDSRLQSHDLDAQC
jgi:hypothetical protein